MRLGLTELGQIGIITVGSHRDDGNGDPDIVLVTGTYASCVLRLALLHALDRFGKPLPGLPNSSDGPGLVGCRRWRSWVAAAYHDLRVTAVACSICACKIQLEGGRYVPSAADRSRPATMFAEACFESAASS